MSYNIPMANQGENEWDLIWESRTLGQKIINFGRRIYNGIFLKFIKKYTNNSYDFLEVGCGSATLGILISKEVKTYTGMDLSEKSVEQAKILFERLNINNSNFIQANILHQAKNTNSQYDIVWSQGVLEYINGEYLDAIRAHYDLTKAGGTTIISVPYKFSYLNFWKYITDFKLFSKLWPWEKTEKDFLSRRELLELGKKLTNQAKVMFLPSIFGFLLGVIILELKK